VVAQEADQATLISLLLKIEQRGFSSPFAPRRRWRRRWQRHPPPRNTGDHCNIPSGYYIFI